MSRDGRGTTTKTLRTSKIKNKEHRKKNVCQSKTNLLSEQKRRSRQTLALQTGGIPKDYHLHKCWQFSLKVARIRYNNLKQLKQI